MGAATAHLDCDAVAIANTSLLACRQTFLTAITLESANPLRF
ncbi:hypothetical protein [Nostoc sp. NIES-3756]|nr:hypothetical protein [Nostoc sp. NIES-3756]